MGADSLGVWVNSEATVGCCFSGCCGGQSSASGSKAARQGWQRVGATHLFCLLPQGPSARILRPLPAVNPPVPPAPVHRSCPAPTLCLRCALQGGAGPAANGATAVLQRSGGVPHARPHGCPAAAEAPDQPTGPAPPAHGWVGADPFPADACVQAQPAACTEDQHGGTPAGDTSH